MALPLAQGDSMPSLDDCPQTTPPNPSRAAGLPRNWWLLCVGITGCLQLECPAALRRNAQITTPRRHAKGSIDVTRSVRRGEHRSIANGRRRRGSNLCAGRPPLRERNRDRLRPALVRYAAWNAAISAAADWRETVAAGASGAS